MKGKDNHIDKIFRDKLSGAESEDPQEPWESLRHTLYAKGLNNTGRTGKAVFWWRNLLNFALLLCLISTMSFMAGDTNMGVPYKTEIQDSQKADKKILKANIVSGYTSLNNMDTISGRKIPLHKTYLISSQGSATHEEATQISFTSFHKTEKSRRSGLEIALVQNALRVKTGKQRVHLKDPERSLNMQNSKVGSNNSEAGILKKHKSSVTSSQKKNKNKNLRARYSTSQEETLFSEDFKKYRKKYANNVSDQKRRLSLSDNHTNVFQQQEDLHSKQNSHVAGTSNATQIEAQTNKKIVASSEVGSLTNTDSLLATSATAMSVSENGYRKTILPGLVPQDTAVDCISCISLSKDSLDQDTLVAGIKIVDTLLQKVAAKKLRKNHSSFSPGISIGAALFPGISNANNYTDYSGKLTKADVNDGLWHSVLNGGISVYIHFTKSFFISTGLVSSTFTQRMQVTETGTNRDTLSNTTYNPISSFYQVTLNNNSVYNPITATAQESVQITPSMLPIQYTFKDSLYYKHSSMSIRYRYAGIPVLAGFNLGKGRFTIALMSGILFNVPVSKTAISSITYDSSGVYPAKQTYIQSASTNTTTYTTFSTSSHNEFSTSAVSSLNELKNVQLFFMGGANIQYKINNRLSLLGGPVLRYSLAPVFKEKGSMQAIPYSLALQFGITYKLR